MKRLLKRDKGTAKGISDALHRSFDDQELAEDEKMLRLIEQMKAFEGSGDAG